MKRLTTALTILACSPLIGAIAVPAFAAGGDTPCGVTHNEFDAFHPQMSVDTVADLFDVPGWYIGPAANDEFKRGYKACWSDDVKVVVWFYDDSQVSEHIDVRPLD